MQICPAFHINTNINGCKLYHYYTHINMHLLFSLISYYLLLLLLQKYHPHDNHVDLISHGFVVIKIRYHVHNSQQVSFVVRVIVEVQESSIRD